jgi:hypothetical protein
LVQKLTDRCLYVEQLTDEHLSTTKMYLSIGAKCPSKTLFYVPHLPAPITAKQFCKDFPDFAKLMDGQATENTLLFYWKYNKQENAYVFVDEDAEDEVAELMGVALYTGEDKDEEEDAPDNRALTEEEIADFREKLKEVRDGLKEWEQRNLSGEEEEEEED